MAHIKADRVATAKLASIFHAMLEKEHVPEDYGIQHGMNNAYVDFQAHMLIKIFGPPSDSSVTKKVDGVVQRGYHIWRNPKVQYASMPEMNFIKKIMLFDDLVVHGDHVDFMYLKVGMAWRTVNSRKEANMISEGLHLNRRKYRCVSGCHNLSAGLAGLFAAWKAACGLKPAWAARKELSGVMHALSMEIKASEHAFEYLKMPVHRTVIDFLNSMDEQYIKPADIAEENIEQQLDVVEYLTRGEFVGKTDQEIQSMVRQKIKNVPKVYSKPPHLTNPLRTTGTTLYESMNPSRYTSSSKAPSKSLKTSDKSSYFFE